jgi:hypothetical protein
MNEYLATDVVLFFSKNPHKFVSRIYRFYTQIKFSNPKFDFFVLSFRKNSPNSIDIMQIKNLAIKVYIFNHDALAMLEYKKKIGEKFSLKPGNCDLPVMLFYKCHREYQKYWVLEDDVEYTGDIGKLFHDLSGMQHALIATHIRPYYKEWMYSGSLVTTQDIQIPCESMRLCFLPFFSVTNYALRLIDCAYREGWSGHHELTWPTIILSNKLSLCDIGGSGPYVPSDKINRYYIDNSPNDYNKFGSFGTMGVRLRPGRRENTLWHPVKDILSCFRMYIKRSLSVIEWYKGRLQRLLVSIFFR